MSPADPPSSYRVIENLIATYAELVDDGDFAGVGVLLADATFTGGAGSVSGRAACSRSSAVAITTVLHVARDTGASSRGAFEPTSWAT